MIPFEQIDQTICSGNLAVDVRPHRGDFGSDQCNSSDRTHDNQTADQTPFEGFRSLLISREAKQGVRETLHDAPTRSVQDSPPPHNGCVRLKPTRPRARGTPELG